MKKKFLSLALPILFASSAFATDYSSSSDSAPAPMKKEFKGVVLGITGGYTFGKVPTQRHDFTVNGLNGGITGGYMTPFGSGFLAGIGFTAVVNRTKEKGNYTYTSAPNHTHDVIDTIKADNTLEAALRIGYALKEVAFYAEGGISSTNTDISRNTTTTTPGAGPGIAPTVTTATTSTSLRHTGPLVGVGCLFRASNNIWLGLNYVSAFYPKEKKNDFDFKKWQHNTLRLSVIYKFN